jgi:hypothetical protein
MRDSFSLRNISFSMYHEYLVKNRFIKIRLLLQKESDFIMGVTIINGIDIKSDGDSVLHVVLIS